jgi:hypothetical protein
MHFVLAMDSSLIMTGHTQQTWIEQFQSLSLVASRALLGCLLFQK